jgi:sugar phosphate permease
VHFFLIEQGIMSWLPTFNSKVLHLPENISIMMASILAISLAVGRLLAGVLTRKINWIWVLSFVLLWQCFGGFVLPKNSRIRCKRD